MFVEQCPISEVNIFMNALLVISIFRTFVGFVNTTYFRDVLLNTTSDYNLW